MTSISPSAIATPSDVQFTGTGADLLGLDSKTSLEVIVEILRDGEVLETTFIPCLVSTDGTGFTSDVVPVQEAGLIFAPIRVEGMKDGEGVVLWAGPSVIVVEPEVVATPANVQFTGTGVGLSLLDSQTSLQVVVEISQSGEVLETTSIPCLVNDEGTDFASEIVQVQEEGLTFTAIQVLGTMNDEEIVLWTR